MKIFKEENYESPEVEMIEVEVEQGFAVSGEGELDGELPIEPTDPTSFW